MKNNIFKASLVSIYPHYVNKAERRGGTQKDVDDLICWLTGFNKSELDMHLAKGTDLETFFTAAPKLNPNRVNIKGKICGVIIEEIKDPIMKEIRYLDKIIDQVSIKRSASKIIEVFSR